MSENIEDYNSIRIVKVFKSTDELLNLPIIREFSQRSGFRHYSICPYGENNSSFQLCVEGIDPITNRRWVNTIGDIKKDILELPRFDDFYP